MEVLATWRILFSVSPMSISNSEYLLFLGFEVRQCWNTAESIETNKINVA